MKYLICNLKSNFILSDILNYKQTLENYGDTPNLIVCPSFCFLPTMLSTSYLTGAQDVSEYGNGSYTGKVSARMLKSINVNCILLNHAELNDKRNKVLAKLKKCLKNKIPVYLFLSEKKEEYDYQYSVNALLKQINYYLNDLKKADYQYLNFIYEPNWLTDELPLESSEINNIITLLKNNLSTTYQHQFKVFYGKNVNLNLIKELALSNVDGFVVGKNSLDVKKVLKMLNVLKK